MRVAKSYENYKFDETKAYEKNGKMYVKATYQCDRCTKGVYVSHVENNHIVPHPAYGGVCLKCSGTGVLTKEVRLYTEKEFEAIERANAKTAERKEAEREAKMKAEYAGKRSEWLSKNGFNTEDKTYVYFPADSYEVKDSLKAAGFKFSNNLLWHIAEVPVEYAEMVVEVALDQVAEIGAWGEGFYRPDCRDYVDKLVEGCRPVEENTSEWIGKEKERLYDIPVVLKSIRGMETMYGYTQLVKFETAEGNELNWWTSVTIGVEVGGQALLTGTVKKLDEYKGRKITVLTRCKIKEA